ncbi:hypothetical protein [Thermogemmatispora carboxidivorans]|uniref:hypothetical protein n=1 Tax=Thermogemmatispora carboxidivorans TaxID=1382306 RepID=UPI00069A5625|nr:hypothetical protein [Thermogemmatispora carboxidivorans]
MSPSAERQSPDPADASALSWWVELGYPSFEKGPDGWPRPGQVIRYYRRLKRRPDGRHWTQADLARARAVSMQSLCRRWPAWREKREQREQEDIWLQAGQAWA